MTAKGEPESTSASGPAQGAVCYLQIPALDPMNSAEFYEHVFGWRIERPYASFEAPGLIGQWVSDRAPGREGGLLVWISVDSIDTTLATVRAHGGELLEPPSIDGPRWIATIRDPAGNTIGIVQHTPR